MAIIKDVQTTAIEVAGEHKVISVKKTTTILEDCLLYTSPSPRDS